MPRNTSKAPLAALQSEMRAAARKLDQLREQVRDSATAIDREPFAILPGLQEGVDRLSEAWSRLSQAIRETQEALRAEEDAALDSYAPRIAAELRSGGAEVTGDPSNLVVDGVVYLVFDRARARITINDVVAADPRVTEVAAEALRVRKHLLDGRRRPEEFVEDIINAYDAELRVSGKGPGEQVRLDAVHHRLLVQRQSKAFFSNPVTSVFREYPRDQFRADLHGLLASGVSASDGRTPVLDSGSDTTGALWMSIPSLGRMGYLGRLRFNSASHTS